MKSQSWEPIWVANLFWKMLSREDSLMWHKGLPSVLHSYFKWIFPINLKSDTWFKEKNTLKCPWQKRICDSFSCYCVKMFLKCKFTQRTLNQACHHLDHKQPSLWTCYVHSCSSVQYNAITQLQGWVVKECHGKHNPSDWLDPQGVREVSIPWHGDPIHCWLGNSASSDTKIFSITFFCRELTFCLQ